MAVPSEERRVFITGINGFTGIHLEYELRSAGFQVYGSCFSKPLFDHHFQCNILDKAQLSEALLKVRPHYVVHLAAISFVHSNNAVGIYETNILGTLNLLEALEALKLDTRKILVASSAAVYGNIGSELSEEMTPKPVNHYGNSKLAMEHMVANYFDRFNILIPRPFNYTGVGQEDHFLIPKIVKHFREKADTISLGNLHTFREYNNVRFLTEIYRELLLSDCRSEVVNVSSGITHSIHDILSLMEKISGYSMKIVVNSEFVRKNEINELKGSTTKLRAILHRDLHPIPIEETLKELYNV